MGYLTTAAFKLLTLAPADYVDRVETDEPGWLQRRLDYWSEYIDSRLIKRYAVPFNAASPPLTVKGWLEGIVTFELYQKRGVDATDQQITEAKERHITCRQEITEAATSATGLFELPLRADQPGTSAVVKPAPMSYTEAGPYNWSRKQRKAEAAEPKE